MGAMVHYQILCTTRKKPNRNVACITTILLFPCCMQNVIVYHCLCKHKQSFIAEYTQEVAQTRFILTAVTQGHTNLILHNLHKRRTIHYCFDSCYFHAISVLPLCTAQIVCLYWFAPVGWCSICSSMRH